MAITQAEALQPTYAEVSTQTEFLRIDITVQTSGCMELQFPQRKPCGWCLLEAAQSREPCWRNIITSNTGSTTITGSDPDARLQLPWHLLEKQNSKLLEGTEENFLIQVIDSPASEEVLLDLLLTNCRAQYLRKSGLQWWCPGGIHNLEGYGWDKVKSQDPESELLVV